MSTKRIVTSRMTLDLTLPDIQKTITVTQGDINRRFEITVVDGGRPFPLGLKWTAALSGKKPSGAALYNSCIVENGKIIYEFAGGPEIATEAGAFAIQFDIYDEVGDPLSSPKIWISVIPNTNRDIASSDQFTALSDIIKKNEENEDAREAQVNDAIARSDAVNQAHAAAEAARVLAEQGRVDTEAARVLAEQERVDTEAARVLAEQGRVDAEAARVLAEQGRVDAEAERKATATSAVQELGNTNSEIRGNEATRQANEKTRQANEEDREDLKAELLRLKAELQRLVDELPGDVDQLPELIDRVNAILDSDDETLDELSEIVAYIKNNKTLIESITTSKVNVTDIIDRLDSTLTNKPLSANQGRVLAGMAESAQRAVEEMTPAKIGAAPTNHAAADTTYGAGSGTNYGHVKLSDSYIDGHQGVNFGIAATPMAVKLAFMDAQSAAAEPRPASNITAGTFAGQVVANASGQTPATSLLRNSSLVSAETDPTVNGEICWLYE